MHGDALAVLVRPDALAYEALEGVLKAHASLDALTMQSPDELRERIRSVNAAIAKSAREIDDIVRLIEHGAQAPRQVAIDDRPAFFAENDVEELVASLPGLHVPAHGLS
jgi:hypothetical protein